MCPVNRSSKPRCAALRRNKVSVGWPIRLLFCSRQVTIMRRPWKQPDWLKKTVGRLLVPVRCCRLPTSEARGFSSSAAAILNGRGRQQLVVLMHKLDVFTSGRLQADVGIGGQAKVARIFPPAQTRLARGKLPDDFQ